MAIDTKFNLPNDGSLVDERDKYQLLYDNNPVRSTTGNVSWTSTTSGNTYDTTGTDYDNQGETGLMNLIFFGDSDGGYTNEKLIDYVARAEDINELQSQITTNTGNISTNTGNISTNTGDISGIKTDINIIESATMSITTGSWISSSGLVYKDFTISGNTIGADDDADIIPIITTETVSNYLSNLGYRYAVRQDSTTIRIYALADPLGTIPCNIRIMRDKGGIV